jgi:NADP-dependent 3-hydroxy acid dehydrogenase YdfG
MSQDKEIAVVVGSTGAMGVVITRRLAAAGLKVVAVARSADALASLVDTGPGVQACVADIGDDSAIEAIRAHLDAPVRMVVQGAGVATAGGVLTAPTSAVVDAVNIKVGGMLRLVRAVDAHLVKGSRLVAIGGHYGFECLCLHRGRGELGVGQPDPPALMGLRPARCDLASGRPRPRRHRAPALCSGGPRRARRPHR